MSELIFENPSFLTMMDHFNLYNGWVAFRQDSFKPLKHLRYKQ
jgi:hypothetical protein